MQRLGSAPALGYVSPCNLPQGPPPAARRRARAAAQRDSALWQSQPPTMHLRSAQRALASAPAGPEASCPGAAPLSFLTLHGVDWRICGGADDVQALARRALPPLVFKEELVGPVLAQHLGEEAAHCAHAAAETSGQPQEGGGGHVVETSEGVPCGVLGWRQLTGHSAGDDGMGGRGITRRWWRCAIPWGRLGRQGRTWEHGRPQRLTLAGERQQRWRRRDAAKADECGRLHKSRSGPQQVSNYNFSMNLQAAASQTTAQVQQCAAPLAQHLQCSGRGGMLMPGPAYISCRLRAAGMLQTGCIQELCALLLPPRHAPARLLPASQHHTLGGDSSTARQAGPPLPCPACCARADSAFAEAGLQHGHLAAFHNAAAPPRPQAPFSPRHSVASEAQGPHKRGARHTTQPTDAAAAAAAAAAAHRKPRVSPHGAARQHGGTAGGD